MTCREFDEFVHGFVRMEMLDVNLRETALEHAGRCTRCSERMVEATLLAEATEAAGRESADLGTPPRVEAAVMAAFRSHHRRASWTRMFEWATAGAVAAVLAVFAWTYSNRTKTPELSSPDRNASSNSRDPLEAISKPTTGPTSGLSAALSAQQNSTASLSNAQMEIADTSSSELFVPSDFVPVPFTAGVASDDPGMVVRVQLTRASLSQLGYPIAETPDEDLILADVLVGQDGWPRGVKLIQ